MPRKIVPYLGFQSDSCREVFHLIPEKKFLALIEQTLACSIGLSQKPPAFGGQMCLIFTGGSGSASVYQGIMLFPRLYAHPDLSSYMGHCGRKSHIGFFCARGMAHSPGEMNVMSAYPYQQMPQPRVGVVR